MRDLLFLGCFGIKATSLIFSFSIELRFAAFLRRGLQHDELLKERDTVSLFSYLFHKMKSVDMFF